MRALLWMPDAWRIPGGHQVQLQRTAEALRDVGLTVEVMTGGGERLPDVDVVHGFGLNAAQVRSARSRGVATAISPIYWSRRYRFEPGYANMSLWRTFVGRFRRAGGIAKACLRGPDALAEVGARAADLRHVAAYEAADVLLPNSESEAEAVRSELGVSTPVHVVPNAVERGLCERAVPSVDSRRRVVCVGRVEPHKNQLAVIRALAPTGLGLDVVGPPHPDHAEYFRECQRAAGERACVHGETPTATLRELQAGARVSVLASWFETTGLASLEAAALGANVVTTDRGFASDYFGPLAWYCDPAKEGSIRAAVLAAWGHPGHPGLRGLVRERYTWERTAQETVVAYETALRQHRRPGAG